MGIERGESAVMSMNVLRRCAALGVIALAVAGVQLLLAGGAQALNVRAYCQSCSFGGEGSGPGEFSAPTAVAISEVGASSGDVYVVDTGNDRVEQFGAAGSFVSEFNGSAAPTGPFSTPDAIAIDNSTDPLDPSSGDVYVEDAGNKVVDKFSASGQYLGQLTAGSEGVAFGELYGVAIDTEGNVWVYQSSGEIDEFADGVTNEFISSRVSPFGTSPGFGVDSLDNLYVNRGSEIVGKITSAGETLIEELGSETTSGVAVDLTNDNVFLDNVNAVREFDSAGAEVSDFGSGNITEGHGLAVDAATKTVYVVDRAADFIRVFPELVVPDTTTGEASELEVEGEATLNGTVDPDGIAVTKCEFEYGPTESYGTVAPCSTSPGNGSSAVPVTARVTGLTPGTTYHFRLVAGNASGENAGKDHTFVAGAPPIVATTTFSGVGATVANVSAEINPDGLATTFRVEYGTTVSYGASTPTANVGSGAVVEEARARLTGLQPETTYHARVVAINAFGTVIGSDISFTTLAAATSLPDGRGYELVSPAATEGNSSIYTREAGFDYLTTEGEHGLFTNRPFQVAPSGQALVYAGDPPPTGGGGSAGDTNGNEYFTARNSLGEWDQQSIQPSSSAGEGSYEAFDSDLSTGIFAGELSALRAGVENYSYSTASGAFARLYPGSAPAETTYAGMNSGTPEVPAGRHLLFQAGQALLDEGTPLASELATAIETVAGSGQQPSALYDSTGGEVTLVSVLPNGKPDVTATYGTGQSDIVAADGSAIFWTDQNTEVTGENPAGTTRLFVRKRDSSPDASTVEIDIAQPGASGTSGGGKFWTAGRNGTRAFFTDESKLTPDATAASGAPDLYEYDTETGTLVDLTVDTHPGESASVQGVVGAGEDGSYVYFVADGALAGGAVQQSCEPGEASSSCNLYVRHEGATTFVAALSSADNTEVVPFDGEGEGHSSGDWQATVANRTAEVAPDGRSLVFMSRLSLTGYPNASLQEVFLYDAPVGHVTCVSCARSGEPPVPTNFDTYHGPVGAFIPITKSPSIGEVAGPKVIADEGDRVFFDSGLPLVSQDTNGWLDVYEWERDGTGSCTAVAGCVYLLSSGANPESSYLLGTSATGDDAFIITRARLSTLDRNGNDDIYDVRVGAAQAPAEGACSLSCAGALPPSPPPTFQGAVSEATVGAGNVSPKRVSPPPPPLTKAQKLAKALKACRLKRDKRKRTSCEAEAHKRFGSRHKPVKRKRAAGKKTATTRKVTK